MTKGAKLVVGATVGVAALALFLGSREDDVEPVELEDERPQESIAAAEAAGSASTLSARLWEIHRQLRERGR